MRRITIVLALLSLVRCSPIQHAEARSIQPTSTPSPHETASDKLDRLERKLDALVEQTDRSRRGIVEYNQCHDECNTRFHQDIYKSTADETPAEQDFERQSIECHRKCVQPPDMPYGGC